MFSGDLRWPSQKIAWPRSSSDRVLAKREVAEELRGVRAPVLRQREQRLVLEVFVLRGAQGSPGASSPRAHREPATARTLPARALPHLDHFVRCASRMSAVSARRFCETRKTAFLRKADRARIAALEHLGEDRHRAICIHLNEAFNAATRSSSSSSSLDSRWISDPEERERDAADCF